jgi:hypothetical protein
VAEARENTEGDTTSIDGGPVKQDEYRLTLAGMMRVKLGSSGGVSAKEANALG